MATNADPDTLPPTEKMRTRRKAILRLNALQEELRLAVQMAQQDKKHSVTELASAISYHTSMVKQFVNKERAAASGKLFDGLVAYANETVIGDEIRGLAKEVNSDKIVGISILPERCIKLAFEIHESFLESGGKYGIEAFAYAFGTAKDLVSGTLNWNQESILGLPSVESSVCDVLLDKERLIRGMEQCLAEKRLALKPLTDQFRVRFDKLIVVYVTKKALAEAMQVNTPQLYEVLGSAPAIPSADTIRKYTALADELMRKHGLENATTEVATDQTTEASSQPQLPVTNEPPVAVHIDTPQPVEPVSVQPTDQPTEVVAPATPPDIERAAIPQPLLEQPPTSVNETPQVIVSSEPLPTGDALDATITVAIASVRQGINVLLELGRLRETRLSPRQQREIAQLVCRLTVLGDLEPSLVLEVWQGPAVSSSPSDIARALGTVTKAARKNKTRR